MIRWMMKFKIASHIGVKEGLTSVKFKHPDGLYEIHLVNHDMRPGIESQVLFAFVDFHAENIDQAEILGRQHLVEFLDVLGFTTSARYRIAYPIAIYDWTPGIQQREGKIYTRISDPQFPLLALDEKYSETIEAILRATKTEPIQRALRWFRVAVSADGPDEQFQWFWLTIETLSSVNADTTKVPDRCPRCREPLYCQNCNETSTHRPYPSQKIEQLFKRHISDNYLPAYIKCTAMRHALLHGENIEMVEKEHNTTIYDLVNIVGNLAWASLLNHFRQLTREAGRTTEFRLLQPTTYLHHNLEGFARVSIGLAKQTDLTITDFPEANITLSAE